MLSFIHNTHCSAYKANIYTTAFQTVIGSVINIISIICTVAMKPPLEKRRFVSHAVQTRAGGRSQRCQISKLNS